MFDGVTTKAVISELYGALKNAKVNRIMQPTKNEVVIETYKNGERNFLEISTVPDNCRICLTNHLKENPQNAYNFCMVLRKHLNSSKIIDISNYDLERTIEIKFEAHNELNDIEIKRLYIQIMSRQSNVILTNEKRIIIDTLKHFDGSNRELLPAHEFKFAPITKTSFIDLETFSDFLDLISENGEELLSQKLPEIFIGFSKSFVLFTIQRLGIDNKEHSYKEMEKLYNYLKELFVKIDTNKISAVNFEKDYTIALEPKNEKLQINKFIDEFYYKKEQKDLITQSKNNLLRVVSSSLKKVYKKLENINQKLKECENMDKYKLYGELLTANLYKINSNQNLDKIIVFDYYNNEDITIKLDSRYSVSKNIERFFKKYNKLKNTLAIVTEQKKETQKEIDYIESIIFSLENAKYLRDISEIYDEVSKNLVVKKDLKKINQSNNRSKEKNIKIEPIDVLGFKVYVGKNNMQNEYLSLKFASKEDLWFHAQKVHGSHVILKTEGKDDIPEEVIYECARLAKENSKAKNSINVPVDYCLAKYVRRIPNGKSGMVNYTNFSTIIVK